MTLELFVIGHWCGRSHAKSVLIKPLLKSFAVNVHIDRARSNSIMAPPESAATELKKRKRGLSVDDLRMFFAQNHSITKLLGTS